MNACIGPNPNADLFICVNGGWVPKNHDIAINQPAPQSTNDFQPPTCDEWEEVETYPGSGILNRVMTRTADPDKWFKDGQTYRHAYGFVARVDGIALRNFDGRWLWSQRLVIIESPGDPQVGRVLYARLFAPRAPWEPIEQP